MQMQLKVSWVLQGMLAVGEEQVSVLEYNAPSCSYWQNDQLGV